MSNPMQQGSHNQSRRRGYTLVELMVASGVSSILLVGMSSTIYVASQAFDVEDTSTADVVEADVTMAQLMRDAQAATSISELTATAATFTVPDRDGDTLPETIRYAWSGTPGDPLTYQYNGGAVETLAADVQNFNLAYLSRFIEGKASGSLLYISGELSGPSANEQAEIDLIESWGYSVTVVNHFASRATIETAANDADVAFVSGEVTATTINSKLNGLTIGVVCEQYDLAEAIGFCEDTTTRSDKEIDIADNTHEITQGFDLGKLKISNPDLLLMAVDDDEGFAGSMQTIATWDGGSDPPSLVIFDGGETDYNGRTVAGRRVMLPWGSVNFDVADLNTDGLYIMEKSIQWAANGAVSQAQQAQGSGGGGGNSDNAAQSASSESSSSSWFSGWLN